MNKLSKANQRSYDLHKDLEEKPVVEDAYGLFNHCVCMSCGERPSQQRHHRFSNTKWARKLYGKLLDDCKNIQWVCNCCGVSHAGAGLEFWNEEEYCDIMGIKVRSKLGGR